MSNIFQTVDWLAMEGLRRLINKSQISQFFNTDYNKEFKREFAVGESVRVKLPQRFLIRNGIKYSAQPIKRKYTTVSCDQIFGIDFEWDSVEEALKLERGRDAIKREYLDPAVDQMAAELDLRCAQYATIRTNNVIGALGTTPTAISVYRRARTLLQENSCPAGERGMIVSPAMMESAAESGTATNPQFNPSNEISRQYREGSVGKYGGFDWYESMHLQTLTSGVRAAGVTVNGAAQSGNVLAVTATAGDTFLAGEVFSIDDVNNANPVSRQSTGRSKYITILQDMTAVGAGNAADVLQIACGRDGIIGPGDQYQNVDALPADTAALTFWPGTTAPSTGPKSGKIGLALHRDAFALVGVKLEVPKAVEYATQMRDPVTGLAFRFTRTWNSEFSRFENRFDTLIGFGDLYPDNAAVKIASLA